MGKLTNELLREESMRTFLGAIGFELKGVVISSIEGLYGFSFDSLERARGFAKRLNKAVQGDDPKTKIKMIGLSDLIRTEIENATSNDKEKTARRQRVCMTIAEDIKQLNSTFHFSEESGLLEVTLPDSEYAPAFQLLKYPHMSCTDDGKLSLDINAYIKDIPEGVLRVNGINANQIPMVFLNSDLVGKTKLFFATRAVEDNPNEVEVSTYLFVPKAPEPPMYHFVLDISGSMQGENLEGLRKSILGLANLIFEYQPSAKIAIRTFNNDYSSPVVYKKPNITELREFVRGLAADGGTALYKTTHDCISEVRNSKSQNNFIIFSDGQDTAYDGYEQSLHALILAVGVKDTVTNTRNKIYVISFNTGQSLLTQKVVKTFKGEIIDVNDTNFLQAIENPSTLKGWASARDLFTASIIVTQQEVKGDPRSFSFPVELSGQMMELGKNRYAPGDTVQVSVRDSNNKLVVESTTTVEKPPAKIENAQLITNLGFRQNTSAAAGPDLAATSVATL